MSNPFLFDDEEEPVESAPNPFLMGDAAESEEDTDNPFWQGDVNPFAFNAAESEPAKEETIAEVPNKSTPSVDKAMSFFGTTISDDYEHDANDPALIITEPFEAEKKAPPPRPTLPNPTTQDLISSVADHLDQTSSHLLDRIPKTRTPSPVSMRDLHTPSPTPDSANLLMSDVLEATQTDNPFVDVDDEPVFPPQVDQQKIPPRPVPPRPSPAHVEPAVQPAEADLFDFGTTTAAFKPQVPKSNQDILSLFAAPKAAEPPKPDLMSDILMMDNSVGQPIPSNVQPVQSQPVQSQPVQLPSPVQSNVQPVQPVQPNLPQVIPSSAPARPAPPQRPAAPPQRPAPPAVPKPPVIEAKPEPPRQPSFEKVASPPANVPEVAEPVETVPVSSIRINDEPYNGVHDLDKSESISDNSSAVDSSIRTPGIATPFYSPGPDAQYLDRGQTPVDDQLNSVKEEMINTYINDASSYEASNPFGSPEAAITPQTQPTQSAFQESDNFDAFAAKFDSVKKDDGLLDSFGGISSGYKSPAPADAWGANDFASPGATVGFDSTAGFEAEEGFDDFLAMQAPPEDETTKMGLAPPPFHGSQNSSIYAEADSSPRYGQSDRSDERSLPLSDENKMQRTGSQESPSTPLFDDDVSQPLEDFPRITYSGNGWEMHLRQPNKKKFTAQRFWKKIFVRLTFQNDTPVIQMFNTAKDKEPFQELPLQGCYSVSEISAQPFDQFGKVFTIKLQYILYKEQPGVRPGQVTKANRITNKLSQFAAYAIQGDYQGVKEFGSDLKKLGLPVEHHPHVSELFKIASHSYEDMKQLSVLLEEQFFKFNVHRDRALTYKFEEVQVTAVDEFFAEQTTDGLITRQIARVRLFFLAFLNGMPTIELGVNDMWRQGKEVVGRHDIIPVATEEWIRLEGVEFHACVQQNEYERSRLIRFQPPDACYIELMRFRVRPPKNRELPLQVKAVWCVTGKRVELRADVLVPGVTSRKLGQIPCEDVSIRFPIPECWIYLFRVEKHFRYGSVKSAHRRTGKIKGIERILGTVDQLQESLIEVTSGQAKYEHHHRAIVWRCSRLPKDGQGAYTTHQMVVRMALTSYDQIPDKLAEHCFVEYTMPQTVVSHATIRSVSVQDSDSDDPPEKYVRYLSRYEYQVGIEYTQGQEQNAYLAATYVKRESPKEEKKLPAPVPEGGSDSDSDSN